MILRDLLTGFRKDLNDLAPAGALPARWTDDQLLRYFNEGMCHVFSLKPNEFIEPILVKLEVGNVQKLCDCKLLHKILGQTDETGAILKPLSKQNLDIVDRWKKRPCSTKSGQAFSLSGYTYSPSDNGHFMVYPAVPPNEEVYVMALCANQPDGYDLTDLDAEVDDCQAVTAARQWVLFSALMVDDESEMAVAAAKIHLELFFQILGLQLTQAKLLELGAKPSDVNRVMPQRGE